MGNLLNIIFEHNPQGIVVDLVVGPTDNLNARLWCGWKELAEVAEMSMRDL